jgi:O-antigen/teichoic acid export membrane protein
LRKGVWGIADHAQMSAANFAMTILLARVLSPRDFGAYALVYSALLFVNGIQGALISQPHTVLGSPRSGQDFVQYTTVTLVTQFFLALLAAAVIAVIALTAIWRGWEAAPLLLLCVPATFAWQMQEFVRRVLYTRSKTTAVFMNDAISYGGQFVLVVLLWRLGSLTTITALTALTVTSALGAILGAWQIQPYLGERPTWQQFRTTATENWHFSKWLLGSTLTTWTSGRMYPILAAGLISVAATGAMKAVQTILGPMNVLTGAMDPLLSPKAARAHARGGVPALRVYISRMQVFVLLTVGVYCVLVGVFSEPILRIVYSDQYSHYAWLLIIMAFDYAFTTVRRPLALALMVLGETSAVFRIRVISSVATLTAGLALVAGFGMAGVGAGILLNGMVMQLVTWHFYARYTGRASLLNLLSVVLKHASSIRPKGSTMEST